MCGPKKIQGAKVYHLFLSLSLSPVVLRFPAERTSVSSTAGLKEQGHSRKPKLPAAHFPTFYPDLQDATRRIGHSSRRARNWCVQNKSLFLKTQKKKWIKLKKKPGSYDHRRKCASNAHFTVKTGRNACGWLGSPPQTN